MADPTNKNDLGYRDSPTYKDRYATRRSGISGGWTIAGLVAVAVIIAAIVYSYNGNNPSVASNTAPPAVGMNAPSPTAPARAPLNTGTGGTDAASPRGDTPPAMQPNAPTDPAK